MDNTPYNKELVGKMIAFGAENIVYHYGDNQVIKFPAFYSLRYLWDKKKYCNELKSGFDLLNQHLRENINSSILHFYTLKNRPTYTVIEPFIDGEALTPENLKIEMIKNQFLNIIETKNNLEKERVFLDLFGLWGLMFWGHKKIPNLLIEKVTQKLYLVDIGTARLDDSRFIISMLLKLAHWRQNQLLRKYLK